MKKVNILILGFLLVSFGSSCGLWPQKLEFFKSKVPKAPAKTEQSFELERQAAVFIDKKIDQTTLAAIKENSSTNILNPLSEAKPLSAALVTSLGPPIKPFEGNPTNLAQNITKNVAQLNLKEEKFDKSIAPLRGKTVDGTGKFSIGYFSYLFIVIGGGYMLYKAISIGINVYSGLNPAFALGANVVKGISSKVTATAFGEVTHGLESLKDHLKTTDQTSFSADDILKLINEHQERKQSPATQDLIKSITK